MAEKNVALSSRGWGKGLLFAAYLAIVFSSMFKFLLNHKKLHIYDIIINMNLMHIWFSLNHLLYVQEVLTHFMQ